MKKWVMENKLNIKEYLDKDEPVSYTHLDVYKRQSKDWEQLYAGLERHASSQNFHPDENDYREEQPKH